MVTHKNCFGCRVDLQSDVGLAGAVPLALEQLSAKITVDAESSTSRLSMHPAIRVATCALGSTSTGTRERWLTESGAVDVPCDGVVGVRC